MDNENKEFYMKGKMEGYMEGYNAAMEKASERAAKPYIDKDGIIERYGGKIGINKAYQIIHAVRQVCGGGKLGSGLVLVSELEYWESLVNKEFVERL